MTLKYLISPFFPGIGVISGTELALSPESRSIHDLMDSVCAEFIARGTISWWGRKVVDTHL